MKDYSLKLSYIISSNKKRNISKVTNKKHTNNCHLCHLLFTEAYITSYIQTTYTRNANIQKVTLFSDKTDINT